MSIIKLIDICKEISFDGFNEFILKNVNLEIEEKEMISIMGPSGSGKTSLLNIIGCLDKYTTGKYLIDNVDVSNLDMDSMAFMRNKKIGFICQNFNLINELTALENVQLPLLFSNIHSKSKDRKSKKEINKLSIEMLTQFGLKEHINKKPSQLSGGQQQRVAIARALINEPALILADEPTGALDQKNGDEVLEILKELNKKGKTIVIVTHDKKVSDYCSRHLLMKDGKLTEC